ncbi:MAG: site-specific integrase [Ignavibacteriales bacterium]|nr:site-specific integrase [Ignavibacteriales bacterium]
MKSNVSLFKPSRSPFWYLQWNDDDGRTRQKSTGYKDKGEALLVLSDLKKFTREKQKPILFSRFAEQFKESNTGTIIVGTLEIYSYTFRCFIRLVGDTILNQITPRHWDLFRAARMKEVRPVTCNIDLRTLRAALSTAVRWKLIESNPFSGQSLCRAAEQRDVAFITVENLQSILAVTPKGHVKDIVAIAFFTGMRLGEIISLQWLNVDFASGIIYVCNDVNFKTKTGKQRAIPMNVETSMILKRRVNQRVDERRLVFPGIRGAFASEQFKEAARLVLGERTPIHFHSLRHSFCSNLVRAGANVRVVQSLAGHTSLSTTEKYLHCVTSDARNAVNLLSMN